MECAEVGSSNGLENRGDRKVNSSMLSHSAIFAPIAQLASAADL
jgi:hypothetical protein